MPFRAGLQSLGTRVISLDWMEGRNVAFLEHLTPDLTKLAITI